MSGSISNDQTYLIGRWLHWIAALVFVVMVIGSDYWTLQTSNSDERELFYFWHIGVGMLFSLFLLLRIGWMVAYPELRTQFDSRWQYIAARTNHYALYTLMILLPLTGVLTRLFDGKDISFFGWLPIELGEWIWDEPWDERIEDWQLYAEEIHLFLKWAVYVLLSLHVLGSLSHWWKKRIKRGQHGLQR